jgi:hypothetical protein
MLTLVAQDGERALRAVEQAEGLLEDEQIAAAHQLLRELIGQDFDVDDDGVPRLHLGTASGRIISTVDTEMRHARKSSSQRFDGYKIHAAVTNTEVPLICAVEVTAASDQDGPQASGLVDSSPSTGARSGCSATPPMAPARSAASWPSARSMCSPRCHRRRSPKDGWASVTSRSTRRPARSPARRGTPCRPARPPLVSLARSSPA